MCSDRNHTWKNFLNTKFSGPNNNIKAIEVFMKNIDMKILKKIPFGKFAFLIYNSLEIRARLVELLEHLFID